VLDLVLFVVFSFIFLLRLVLYRSAAVSEIFENVREITYLGAPAIAFLTLVAQVALTCSNSWGHGFTILAYVLWSIGMAWIVTVCTTLYISAAKLSIIKDATMPTAVFLPLVGVMTAATVGGLMANYAYEISGRLAMPVIIVSYMCVGYGVLVSLLAYASYLHKLMITGWPPADEIPGLILLASTNYGHLLVNQYMRTDWSNGAVGHCFATIRHRGKRKRRFFRV